MKLRIFRKRGTNAKHPKDEFAKFFWVKTSYLRNLLKIKAKLTPLNFRYIVKQFKAVAKADKQNAIEFLKDIIKITKNPKFRLLDKEIRRCFLTAVIPKITVLRHRSIEKIVDDLFELAKSGDLKKIEDLEKLMERFVNGWLISQKIGNSYLIAILKTIKNGINESCNYSSPIQLLKATIEEYQKRIANEEFDSLDEIQEIVRDLIIAHQSGISKGITINLNILKNPNHIFNGITQDQFNVLCCKLAEENPGLVEEMGRKLFEEAA